jgi:pimeloyl-ACP methyl ester carboxylesterase
MDASWHISMYPKRSAQLIVFLPGNRDNLYSFKKYGLIQEVERRMPDVDYVTVNAVTDYYIIGSIIARLKEDVIEPAKKNGYKKIWLVGTSLGGYGSLLYMKEHSEDIAGVVLLGPYLGRKKTVKEITESGGLLKWQDNGEDLEDNSQEIWDEQPVYWLMDEHDEQKKFWNWLKDYEQKNASLHNIILGYGKSDKYAYGSRLLASILPRDQVIIVEGGHNWTTWRLLWSKILDTKMCCMARSNLQ